MNERNDRRQQQVPIVTDEAFKSWEITSLTLGILSIILCFIMIMGIGFGIAGIAYARKCEKYRARSAMAVWGEILSIIGLVCSILVTGILLVCLFPYIVVLGGVLLYILMRITSG